MGNPEDMKSGYIITGTEPREQEAAASKNAALLPEQTKTEFEDAIGKIEDLALLGLAKNYLTGVANITKDKLEAYMKNFMERNNIAEDAKALELIKTINACLFLDDKHGDRVTDMTTFLSRRETALKAEKTTNN
jgi:hypothetical protein